MREVGMQSGLRCPFHSWHALFHDDSGWTAMSVDEPGNGCQWKVLNETLPSSSETGLVERKLQESPRITPSHASVGTSTDEGAEDRSRGMIGKPAGHRGSADTMVEMTTRRCKLIVGAGIVGFCWWSSRRRSVAISWPRQ